MTVHLCLVLRVRMTGAVFLLALHLSGMLKDSFTFYIAWDCDYFSILYFSQEQATLKAKQRMLREDWELFKAQRKLLQQKMWNKTARYCMLCVCSCLMLTVLYLYYRLLKFFMPVVHSNIRKPFGFWKYQYHWIWDVTAEGPLVIICATCCNIQKLCMLSHSVFMFYVILTLNANWHLLCTSSYDNTWKILK